MSLRIIYGRAGSGKSTYCLNEIKSELEKEDSRPLILLVPEQFSLQAEKKLARATRKGGIINCEVLTFRRMASRVLSETGGLTLRRLNSSGKCMLIYRILQNMRQEFTVLSKAAGKRGFVNTMSEIITEFKRYNITPELMDGYIEKLDNKTLGDKLSEIGVIYKEFQKHVHEKYMDLDDDITELAKRLDSSTQFDGAKLWIDEFSGFTPQEFSVIEQLLKKSHRVSFCLCTDCLSDDFTLNPCDLFFPVKKTAGKLIETARKSDITIETPVNLTVKSPHEYSGSPELAYLESRLFNYSYTPFKEPVKDIEIFTSVNIYTEVENAASKIVSLCRDNSYRYRDIVVLCGNLTEYEKYVENIFSMYEIPFFIDSKRDITGHPLVSLITSALEIFINNWSYEPVFRYLKTGLTNLDIYEVDLMENYVLAYGIKGSMWTSDRKWTFGSTPSMQYREKSKAELFDVPKINEIREKITEPLKRFKMHFKKRNTAKNICTGLYKLLNEIGVPAEIESLVTGFEESGRLELANEYSQIWNIIMEVFDQIVEVLQDTEISIKDFNNILKTGFSEYKLGLVPPSVDRVLVGSAERSKSDRIKALFVIGVNDGSFPMINVNEGIISDTERLLLNSVGMELAQDTRTKAFEENYLVYRALTSCSKQLMLSFPIADEEGRTMRPSRIISTIRHIFPHIKEKSNIIEGDTDEENLDLINSPGPTFNKFLYNLKKHIDICSMNPVWWDVGRWYIKSSQWEKRLKTALTGLDYSNITKNLNADCVAQGDNDNLYTSISRLEKYVNCPFSYFIEYSLNARERKIYRLAPPDVGSFVHNVIDGFSKHILQSGTDWCELSWNDCYNLVCDTINNILENESDYILNSSKRYRFFTNRFKKIITRSVWLIREHIRRSGFEPAGYELSFGYDNKIPPVVLNLPSGHNITLSGRIDRLDKMETDEGTYIRIIDYKSGSKNFRLSDVYHGQQIQLITYLDAVGENGMAGIKDPLLPGGILYFKIDDPIIRTKSDMPGEEIETAIMKELKMKGLLLADVDIIRKMDTEIEGTSLIIPARINKGEVLSKTSSAATMKQFNLLRRHTRSLLKKICTEIMEGNISISPWKKKNNTSCDYCNYSSICRFDTSIPGNDYRNLHDIKDNDIWKLLDNNET